MLEGSDDTVGFIQSSVFSFAYEDGERRPVHCVLDERVLRKFTIPFSTGLKRRVFDLTLFRVYFPFLSSASLSSRPSTLYNIPV